MVRQTFNLSGVALTTQPDARTQELPSEKILKALEERFGDRPSMTPRQPQPRTPVRGPA